MINAWILILERRYGASKGKTSEALAWPVSHRVQDPEPTVSAVYLMHWAGVYKVGNTQRCKSPLALVISS